MKPSICLFALALAQTAPAVNELPSPFEVAEKNPELSDLKMIYSQTEMKFKIDQSRDVTVFMPNNAALKAMPLSKLSYPRLVQILNYHNLGRVVRFEDLHPGEYTFETIEGGHIQVKIANDKSVRINGDALVVGSSIETPMGIAYIIDHVLMPSSTEETTGTLALTDYDDKIAAPGHIIRANEEQRIRNDISGLVEATAGKVEDETSHDDVAAEVGVITPEVRRQASRKENVGKQARNRHMEEYKSSRARATADVKVVRVSQGRDGYHHSGGPDVAFREKGKLY